MKTQRRLFALWTCVIGIFGGGVVWYQQADSSTNPQGKEPAHMEQIQKDHAHCEKEGGSPHGHEGETDAGKAEVSDLDLSIDDLWSKTCEHDIRHYTCDECRYELGVVKLSEKIFSKKDHQGLVSVATPSERRMGKVLPLTGEVVINDLSSVRVSSIVSGVIRNIRADVGRKITKGQVLFELDSQDAAEAKADYLKKMAILNLAKKTAEREINLFAKKISAEVEVVEAKNKQVEAEIELAGARTRLERMGISNKEIEVLDSGSAAAVNSLLPVYAAIDGVILERLASPGDQVTSGQEIMLISDI